MAALHIFAMGMSGVPHSWKLKAAPVHRTVCAWLETFFFPEYWVTESCLGLTVKELLSRHLYTLKH